MHYQALVDIIHVHYQALINKIILWLSNDFFQSLLFRNFFREQYQSVKQLSADDKSLLARKESRRSWYFLKMFFVKISQGSLRTDVRILLRV